MKIASLLVEFFEGRGEEARSALSPIEKLTIYGEKENKLVIVIESQNLKELTQIIEKISDNSFIKNVIPVYISDI